MLEYLQTAAIVGSNRKRNLKYLLKILSARHCFSAGDFYAEKLGVANFSTDRLIFEYVRD